MDEFSGGIAQHRGSVLASQPAVQGSNLGQINLVDGKMWPGRKVEKSSVYVKDFFPFNSIP